MKKARRKALEKMRAVPAIPKKGWQGTPDPFEELKRYRLEHDKKA